MIYPVRGQDKYGSGEFEAPRSKTLPDGTVKRYKHRGVDFECPPGSVVKSISDGIITQIGYCYADDLSYRYVQIADPNGLVYRYLYVDSMYDREAHIRAGEIIGRTQDLEKRYPGITPHYHLDVKKDGKYLNPMQFIQRSEV